MEPNASHHMISGEHSPKEVAKFVAVIAGIIALTAILGNHYGPGLPDWLRLFMGVFFAVFGSFKLLGYRMFAEMFAGYDIVARRIKAYAFAFPFIELSLAALYLFNLLPGYRDVATLTIMAISTVGVAQEIKRRSGIHCACLGNIIKLPLSTVSLVEDVGMALMAVAMLVFVGF